MRSPWILCLLLAFSWTATAAELSPHAQEALATFDRLNAVAQETKDICSLGGRIWAKVLAARTAYEDIDRAVNDVGPNCSGIGGTDILGLQHVIKHRVKRLKLSDDFKAKCLAAWADRIAVEKAFVKGPEQIIEIFQSTCYGSSDDAENSDDTAVR